MADATRREKARGLRYKKAILKDVNLYEIRRNLEEISEACDDVQYFIDGDDDTLINALDGDEDEAYEFRMMFADLSAECDRMWDDMQDTYTMYGIEECFDDFFTAIGQGEQMLGYDTYEEDYYGLEDSIEERWACDEAKKRLMRMTKNDIIDTAHRCFRLFRSYMGLIYRYDCLKASMDILRDQNTGYLQMVKQIDELYDRADDETNGFQYLWKGESLKELDKMLDALPQEAWIQ